MGINGYTAGSIEKKFDFQLCHSLCDIKEIFDF